MKPHLKKIRGYWYCASDNKANMYCGMGWTPAQAYADWLTFGIAA